MLNLNLAGSRKVWVDSLYRQANVAVLSVNEGPLLAESGTCQSMSARAPCVKLYCFVSNFIVLCPTLFCIHSFNIDRQFAFFVHVVFRPVKATQP